MSLEASTILLTGGTGSFGNAFVARALAQWPDATIRVFSRDELKQSEMQERFDDDRVRYFIGDVRDRRRLTRAAQGADVIVHAAAMKQVPASEYNPFEAVQTNVIGAQNVVDAAIDAGVRHVVALSTDKAVNPVNLYGATKLCAEKIIVQGNAYASGSQTRLSCVRYGNVVGSRGSVVPLFRRQIGEGRFTITDERMTRFWITLDQAVDLVLYAFDHMVGGEVFIPKIPSIKVDRPGGGDGTRTCRSRSSASGRARSCTRVCSPSTRRATRSTPATCTSCCPSTPWWDDESAIGRRARRSRTDSRTRPTRTTSG